MSKYTAGPLKVSIWPEWPFYIHTFDRSGELVFRREMPMYSTKQKTAEEAMAGAHMGKYADQACETNARALADEVLRASAPELLAALRLAVLQNSHDMLLTGEEIRFCESAIAKALGNE